VSRAFNTCFSSLSSDHPSLRVRSPKCGANTVSRIGALCLSSIAFIFAKSRLDYLFVRLSGSKQALVYGTVRLSSDTLNAMIDTCTIPINIAIARLHANEILAKDETLRHRSPLYSYGGPILSPPRNSNSSACPGTSSSTHARRLGAPRPHGMQQKIRRRSRSHQRVLQQQELGKKRSPLHERSQLKTQDSSGD
jgi:hypothetical protein